MHADDYLLQGAITKMVGALERHPEAMLAFSRRSVESTVESFLSNSSELHGPLEPLSECTEGAVLIKKFIRDGARRNLFGEPTAIMFSREIAVNVGGFSRDLPQLLDVGFWLALLEHGAAVWIDEPLSVRVHTYGSASELNLAQGIGSLDVVRVQLALTRSPILSPLYRLIVARLAAVSFAKALGKAVIEGPLRSRVADLALLAREYVAGDLRALGEVVCTDRSGFGLT